METVYPILYILVTYLLIVKIVGPRFMKTRKPYDLKRVIQCYNMFQVISCILLIYAVSLLKNILSKMLLSNTKFLKCIPKKF